VEVRLLSEFLVDVVDLDAVLDVEELELVVLDVDAGGYTVSFTVASQAESDYTLRCTIPAQLSCSKGHKLVAVDDSCGAPDRY
jgi:hypothetical protein